MYCLILYMLVNPVVSLKTWIHNTDMSNKENWSLDDTPQHCDDISFAATDDISIYWTPKDLLIAGLTMAKTGSIIFDSDLTFRFGNMKTCPKPREMVYSRYTWKSWLNPYNWKSEDKSWVPHAERIPCFGEKVVFPSGKHFAVVLPSVMVPPGKIVFENEEYDGEEWADFLGTNTGKNQFTSPTETEIWSHQTRCNTRKKCSCGSSPYTFKQRSFIDLPNSVLVDAVCLQITEFCPNAECYSPIIPEGHCCQVCGSVVKIEDNTEDDEKLRRIRTKIASMKEKQANDHVIHYVGRTQDGHIQVVILPENPDSADEAMKFSTVIHRELKEKDMATILSVEFSGSPLSGYFMNNIFGVIFGTLFGVLVFFAVLYYIYVILPKKNPFRMMGESSFRFARFKNTDVTSEERVEIGGGGGTIGSRGFHNPTFATGSGEESKPKTSDEATEEDKKEQQNVPDNQEYENPVYHEMEKTRELNLLDVNSEESENSALKEFSEIEL